MTAVEPNGTLGRAPDGTYSERYLGMLDDYMVSLCDDDGMIVGVNYGDDGASSFEVIGFDNCNPQKNIPQGQFFINSLFEECLADARRTIQVDRKLTDTSSLTDWEKFVGQYAQSDGAQRGNQIR